MRVMISLHTKISIQTMGASVIFALQFLNYDYRKYKQYQRPSGCIKAVSLTMPIEK